MHSGGSFPQQMRTDLNEGRIYQIQYLARLSNYYYLHSRMLPLFRLNMLEWVAAIDSLLYFARTKPELLKTIKSIRNSDDAYIEQIILPHVASPTHLETLKMVLFAGTMSQKEYNRRLADHHFFEDHLPLLKLFAPGRWVALVCGQFYTASSREEAALLTKDLLHGDDPYLMHIPVSC